MLISGNVIKASRGGCEITTVPRCRFLNMMKSKKLVSNKSQKQQKKDQIKAEIREDEKHIKPNKKTEKTKGVGEELA